MYYPQTRSHLQVLPPGAQQQVGPPPTSPGYTLYAQHHPHLAHTPIQHHHHQNSINHYPSPPNHALQPHGIPQGSPANLPIAQHWQQQLLKCEMSRQSRSPHHRARASAMASRTITKSAIPITNPNAVKSPDPEPSSDDPSTPNHPSSTAPPIADAPRPTAARPPENNWSSLDMGGVSIKNLPPTSGLFSFTFLINLYLNHNALSSVPPEISKLRHLELLDLSGNALTSLPPQLGMICSLKELYLFDNHLTTLPLELGSLHQLRTLGVEGNPLDNSLKAIVQKDGTPALISYLRDSCPVPAPPPNRPWKSLLPSEQDAPGETFTVLCYNILCKKYATERLYGYTPSWALNWDYRRDLILTEVMGHHADFLCLQEVDATQYQVFVKQLGAAGYQGFWWPKSRAKTMAESDRRQVDGCATFYKASTYQLVEKRLVEFAAVAMQRTDFKKTEDMFNRVLGKDHIATICLLENKFTGTRLVLANMHIHWDPAYSDVKLVQVALLVDEVEKMAEMFAKYPPRLDMEQEDGEGEFVNGNGNGKDEESEAGLSPSTSPKLPFSPQNNIKSPTITTNGTTKFKAPTYSDGTKIPVVICGDFNSVPSSGVYEFLSTGALAKDHPDFRQHTYGRYTSEGLRHQLGLRSAYSTASTSIPPPNSAVAPHSSASSSFTPSSAAAAYTNGHATTQPLRKSLLTPPGGGENGFELLQATNYTPSYQGVLDYIWYTPANMTVSGLLGDVDGDYLDKVVGFPNAHFPSDHLCLVSQFRVKPPKENPPRPPPT